MISPVFKSIPSCLTKNGKKKKSRFGCFYNKTFKRVKVERMEGMAVQFRLMTARWQYYRFRAASFYRSETVLPLWWDARARTHTKWRSHSFS